MTVKVSSIGLRGLEGYRVQAEVQISPGMTSMVIVGLPDASVKESKERVLSAIRSLGKGVNQKVVVNLSPSDQKKNGPMFDLAIAIGVLKEMGDIKSDIPADSLFIGAMSLDGSIEKVEGMLPALIAAKSLGFSKVFLPYDPLLPIDMFEDLECFAVQHINEVIQYLHGQSSLALKEERLMPQGNSPPAEYQKDFSHIIGHGHAKFALEIAAAGGHNVLMSGPPGCCLLTGGSIPFHTSTIKQTAAVRSNQFVSACEGTASRTSHSAISASPSFLILCCHHRRRLLS